MTQQLFFGDECLSKMQNLIQSKGWNRLLLVTGKTSYKSSGAEDFINDCLSGLEVGTERFCDFANNPNISDLKKGLELIRRLNPSAIIAIGGGSVVDMSKLLRFFLTHDGEVLSGTYTSNGKNIPLMAIPTTAGTGAEATHFAVIYDENGRKYSIADKYILPDYAVVYPPLTYGQSPYVTACTGFDALAQAIEAYWNKNATEESDRYAETAMNLIYPSLPDAVSNPTKEIRDRMAEGAYWAGRAINITKTTAPHAFSYPFTSNYGIPHGHAVAIVFPVIAKYNLINSKISPQKKEYLNNIFHFEKKSNKNIIDLLESIGLTLPSQKYDINLLIDGISVERLANNPTVITNEMARQLLSEITLNSTAVIN